jgi:hypothetical protein
LLFFGLVLVHPTGTLPDPFFPAVKCQGGFSVGILQFG